jgi:TRAP-type C4-dicarboxylate transport system substrate-binding protein
MVCPRSFRSIFCLVATLVFSSHAFASRIDFGIITPEGSAWTKVVHEMRKELETQSNGKIKLKVFAGGQRGDDPQMLQAMALGTLDAAALSGVGLQGAVSSIRILETPLLYRSNEEVDLVKEELFDYFAKEFAKPIKIGGKDVSFELLGFAEAGLVNVFSKQKIDTLEALRKTRMWVWKGDTFAEMFMKEFGIPAEPKTIDEVPSQLAGSNGIDSFYAPPLAAVAFQWSNKVKYMMDFPFVNSSGAFIMRKDKFEKLSPEHQKLMRDTVKKYSRMIVEKSREDNVNAMNILKNEQKIEFLKPSPADIKQFEESARKVYTRAIGQVYHKDLFDRVQAILEKARKAKS